MCLLSHISTLAGKKYSLCFPFYVINKFMQQFCVNERREKQEQHKQTPSNFFQEFLFI